MKDNLKKIIEAAMRAPSGDNTQPWKLEVSGNNKQVDLFNLPERDTSYFNDNQMAAYVAHGALIENFLIAAQTVGYAVKLSLFPSPENPEHIARFNLSETKANPDPLYPAIFKRQTDRNKFISTPLTQEQVDNLNNAVSTELNATLKLITDKDQKNRLSWLLRNNDRLVFEHKAIHQFLFDKIRWNKEEVDSSQDGMPVETLGLNPAERLLFPAFKRWETVKFFNKLMLSRIIGLKGWFNCRTSSALGIITVKEISPLGFLNAGRATQRVWLQATVDRLAFQPVTGLFFLFQRAKDSNLEGFDKKQIELIKETKSQLQQLCGYDREIPVMGFRVGKSGNPDQEPLTKRIS
jgi:hypothetical protein